MANTTLTFLLTERRRFSGQKIGAVVAKALGRADKLPSLKPGEQAQLERHVSILPRRWPMAALARQLDVGDAGFNAWLRADPAHVRAEMGVVRLLTCGDLGLTQQEAEDFLKPLKIMFGDVGFPLSAPNPARWYLALPKESRLPVFPPPEEAIGSDIFSQLPTEGPEKRWRSLLNEAQIILHNHPLNAERLRKGLLPVNSLYFWGGGVLPDEVSFHAARVVSEDVGMRSLMLHAGITDVAKNEGASLHDLRHARDWSSFESATLLPALSALSGKKYSSIVLDFADGTGFEIKGSQSWRFWRAPLHELA